MTGMLRGLLAACHPGPTAAVSTLVALLGVSAGLPAGRCMLLAAAVLAGQLSIGWSNDWLDAARDAAVARADKPVARGALRPSQARSAAFVALGATLVLSLALGALPGAIHLVCVAGGWAYNLGLKSSAFSAVPYVTTFGLFPAVVTTSLPDGRWPHAWLLLTGALLGLAAHFSNVLPDLEDDAATGVRGLPHRLGRTATSLLAPAVLALASVLVVLGPAGPVWWPSWTALGVALALAVVAAVSALSCTRTAVPFRCTIAIAGVAVVLLLSRGRALS
jgi:4-hydroxybenzoate polyprenyltransferase